MTETWTDDFKALSRAQWALCIPIVEDAIENGLSPDDAAKKAYAAIDPSEVRVGALLALSAYAMPEGVDQKLSWLQVAMLEETKHPAAIQFANRIRYYLPPMDLISLGHV